MNFGIADIREMTGAMSQYPGMEYDGYVLSFIFRRLAYIFDKLRVRRKDDFILKLEDDAFREQVKTLMCVEATEMFRDPSFWRTLRDKILINSQEENQVIWFPKTSSGEEPFSLSIILEEMELSNRYKIICSCPTKTILDKITNGEINNKNFDVNQTNYKRLEKFDKFSDYIRDEGNEKAINEVVLENIDPILGSYQLDSNQTSGVELILYRNESLYLSSKKAETIYNNLVGQLKPGGYLIIGVKDYLPKSVEERLKRVDSNERIYQKITSQKSIEYGF